MIRVMMAIGISFLALAASANDFIYIKCDGDNRDVVINRNSSLFTVVETETDDERRVEFHSGGYYTFHYQATITSDDSSFINPCGEARLFSSSTDETGTLIEGGKSCAGVKNGVKAPINSHGGFYIGSAGEQFNIILGKPALPDKCGLLIRAE